MTDSGHKPENDIVEDIEDMDDFESFDDPAGPQDVYDDFPEEEDGLDFLDDDFSDDDWEDEDSDFGDPLEGAGTQKKKSGLSFNAIVISLAVLVGFGVLVFQVVSKKPQAVERYVTALKMSGSTDGPVFGDVKDVSIEQNKKSDTESSGGFLNDPDQLPQGPEPEDQDVAVDTPSGPPPMPAPVVTSQDDAVEPARISLSALSDPEADTDTDFDSALTPMPDAAFGSPELTDSGDSTGGQDALQVPRTPDALLPDTINTAEKPQQPSASDILDSAIAARDERKEPLPDGADSAPDPFAMEDPAADDMAVNDVTEPEMSVPAAQNLLAEDVPDGQPSGPVLSGDLGQKLGVLIERLDRMESRLEELSAADDRKLERIEQIASGLEQMKKDVGGLKTAPPQKQASRTSTASASKVRKKAPSRPRWVLRAAQPGKAWVSKAGDTAMKRLQVGDTLSGIGRITAIAYTNGHWVVQGTQGRILQ